VGGNCTLALGGKRGRGTTEKKTGKIHPITPIPENDQKVKTTGDTVRPPWTWG